MIITKENLHNYVDSLGYSTEELEEMKIETRMKSLQLLIR